MRQRLRFKIQERYGCGCGCGLKLKTFTGAVAGAVHNFVVVRVLVPVRFTSFVLVRGAVEN